MEVGQEKWVKIFLFVYLNKSNKKINMKRYLRSIVSEESKTQVSVYSLLLTTWVKNKSEEGRIYVSKNVGQRI